MQISECTDMAELHLVSMEGLCLSKVTFAKNPAFCAANDVLRTTARAGFNELSVR